MVKSSSGWSTFPMSSIESKKHDLIKQQRPNMSSTYEFVQLDVFTRTPFTGNPLAIFSDVRGVTCLRQGYGGRCQFSVRLFQLIVGQAHRAQECIPARVVVEIR